MTRSHPYRNALFLGVAVYLALTLWHWFCGIAHADPLATAQISVDASAGVLVTYGPVIGGMYLAYAIASALVAKYHSSSWLAQGKRLAYATSALGVVGAALQVLGTGASWNVVLAAAVAAAFKLLMPVMQPASGQAGKVVTAVAVWLACAGLLGLAIAGSGCTKAKTTAVTAKTALINCTGQAIGTTPGLDLQTLAAVTKLVADERNKCTGPAGIVWQCVETDLLHEGEVLGGCAFVRLVADAMAASAAGKSTSSLVAGPVVVPGRAELEDFRGRVVGGVKLTWHTSTGEW